MYTSQHDIAYLQHKKGFFAEQQYRVAFNKQNIRG